MIENLRREPVVLRAFVAALVSYLVLADVLDTGAGEALEAVVVALVDLVLLVSARQAVAPVKPDPRLGGPAGPG